MKTTIKAKEKVRKVEISHVTYYLSKMLENYTREVLKQHGRNWKSKSKEKRKKVK